MARDRSQKSKSWIYTRQRRTGVFSTLSNRINAVAERLSDLRIRYCPSLLRSALECYNDWRIRSYVIRWLHVEEIISWNLNSPPN